MKFEPNDGDQRRERALERFGTRDPRCLVCGETRWQSLDLHHLAGKAFDEMTVLLCCNCHRAQSDPTENAKPPDDPALLERIGHFLLGLAAFLQAIVDKIRGYGRTVLEAIPYCQRPYGYGPALGDEAA